MALESWQREWARRGYFIQRVLTNPLVREAVLARGWKPHPAQRHAPLLRELKPLENSALFQQSLDVVEKLWVAGQLTGLGAEGLGDCEGLS